MKDYNNGDQARKVLSREPDDFRGPWGRDKDRVLYSSSFRRLAGKTQVIASGELGDFHNRMTHSLKVAQVGHRLAQNLQNKPPRQARLRGKYLSYAPNPELVEAACLAHDLGHPPFGHAGEHALQEATDQIFRDRLAKKTKTALTESELQEQVVKFGGFEGNAQTLRILIRLSSRQPRGSRGLSLTRAVLDATIKYPWTRQPSGRGASKWNVYPDDLEYANWIRDDHPLGNDADQSVEAKLMDWSDDVTYACHDVQDFYRAGLIPLDRLFTFRAADREQAASQVPVLPGEAQPFFEFVQGKWEGLGKCFDPDAAARAWQALFRLMPISGPYDGGRVIKSEMHRLNSGLITHFVNSVSVASGRACRYRGEIEITASAKLQCDLLQELIWFYVIGRPALASQQYGQMRIVKDLLQIFSDDEQSPSPLLPRDRQEDVDEGVDYLRACVDHVASLRESEAVAMHQRLTGTHVGYHSDGTWRI